MTKDEAKRVLREHAAEICARGVTRLALFGSVVRDEAGQTSDVDVLIDIDRNAKFSLLDRSGLRLYLCDILGGEADLTIRDSIKPFPKDAILDEAVEVFG